MFISTVTENFINNHYLQQNNGVRIINPAVRGKANEGNEQEKIITNKKSSIHKQQGANYIVPEAHKTEWEKSVGTILDLTA